jgi:hypothetical protein
MATPHPLFQWYVLVGDDWEHLNSVAKPISDSHVAGVRDHHPVIVRHSDSRDGDLAKDVSSENRPVRLHLAGSREIELVRGSRPVQSDHAEPVLTWPVVGK